MIVAFDKNKKNSNALAEELCKGAIGKDVIRKGLQFDKRQGKGTSLLSIIGNQPHCFSAPALLKWERRAGAESFVLCPLSLPEALCCL